MALFKKKDPMSMPGRGLFGGCFGIMALGFISVASLVGYRACKYATADIETVEAKVNRTGTVVQNNNSTYMIYTDKEVFMNTDDPFRSKYNSSDVQGAIVDGCTYQFNVAGERNQKLSMYRNVITAKHTAHAPTPNCTGNP